MQLVFFTVLLLLSLSASIVRKWDSAGCIRLSGFLLTDGLTVLFIYLPFMVKTNIFTIHRCCEESTGELWKKMNANSLAWLLVVCDLVIRGILQHSQS